MKMRITNYLLCELSFKPLKKTRAHALKQIQISAYASFSVCGYAAGLSCQYEAGAWYAEKGTWWSNFVHEFCEHVAGSRIGGDWLWKRIKHPMLTFRK